MAKSLTLCKCPVQDKMIYPPCTRKLHSRHCFSEWVTREHSVKLKSGRSLVGLQLLKSTRNIFEMCSGNSTVTVLELELKRTQATT